MVKPPHLDRGSQFNHLLAAVLRYKPADRATAAEVRGDARPPADSSEDGSEVPLVEALPTLIQSIREDQHLPSTHLQQKPASLEHEQKECTTPSTAENETGEDRQYIGKLQQQLEDMEDKIAQSKKLQEAQLGTHADLCSALLQTEDLLTKSLCNDKLQELLAKLHTSLSASEVSLAQYRSNLEVQEALAFQLRQHVDTFRSESKELKTMATDLRAQPEMELSQSVNALEQSLATCISELRQVEDQPREERSLLANMQPEAQIQAYGSLSHAEGAGLLDKDLVRSNSGMLEQSSDSASNMSTAFVMPGFLSTHFQNATPLEGSLPSPFPVLSTAPVWCTPGVSFARVPQVLPPGAAVIIDGLMLCPIFNGWIGIIDSYDAKTRRYNVQMPLTDNSGVNQIAKIRPENLKIYPTPRCQ